MSPDLRTRGSIALKLNGQRERIQPPTPAVCLIRQR